LFYAEFLLVINNQKLQILEFYIFRKKLVRAYYNIYSSVFQIPDKSLDVVFLNGVLEWLPEYNLSSPPRKVQLDFLREVRRSLKNDGQILIGIENRIGYPYFFGRQDDHSKIKFATLLPRPLADLVSRIKFHKPYRTFTYGPAGYRRLLQEAGFKDIQINVPAPNYREITQIFLAEAKKSLVSAPEENQRGWKKKLKNFA
jgi:SAM-dependent methyltransferase